MDAKLPMDIFENVMQLAIEGCKAVAHYIREVRDVVFHLHFFTFSKFVLLLVYPVVFTLFLSCLFLCHALHTSKKIKLDTMNAQAKG